MSVIPSLATKITGKFTPVMPLARIGRRNARPPAQHIIPQCLVPHRETTGNQKKICARRRQAIKSGRIRFVGRYLPPFAMAVIEQGRALCSMWSTGVFVEIAYDQTGAEPDEVTYVELDLKETEPGRQRVTVTVNDLLTEEEVTKDITFTIVPQ